MIQTQIMATAAIEWTSMARRVFVIDVNWAKYWSHMTSPLEIRIRISTDIDQNTSFWPALYLPTSGTLSSWLDSTSPARDSQVPSSGFHRLAFQNRRKRPRKLKNRTTPIQGWMIRV